MRLNIKHAFVFSLSILTLILFFINFGYYDVKYDNTLIRIKPLIVDFDCLENQNKGKDCTYPIAVAIPDGYPQMSNEFIEIKFTLDISENSRDFWLFKNVDNSTDLIATRRFNRSKSNIENVEMPSDWKAFKRDWKKGKYLESSSVNMHYNSHISSTLNIRVSDYGKEEWKKDFPTKNFVWHLSHKNVEAMEFYTELEWPNVYLYVTNKTERFDSKKVDEWIKNINKTL
uniref:W02B3.4-like N-terminal domain-containing protein n=1 Tax=Meloidogyne javanica TaxID=6303 RepID=A0A915MZA2_MELJA